MLPMNEPMGLICNQHTPSSHHSAQQCYLSDTLKSPRICIDARQPDAMWLSTCMLPPEYICLEQRHIDTLGQLGLAPRVPLIANMLQAMVLMIRCRPWATR